MEEKESLLAFELGRRLEKIEALAAVLSNQTWDAPLAGEHLDECAEMIVSLAKEGKELLEKIRFPKLQAAAQGGAA